MSLLNENIILENDRVRLEPLEEKHFEPLNEIAKNTAIWEFTSAKINSTEDFREYFDTALNEIKTKVSYVFAVFDKKENVYGGCTRYANISLQNKRVEIGWSWYHPALQRSGLNRNCKFLLLSFGFEKLALNRIELKTSHLNNRSQTAMRKIGAVEEGTLRRHAINDDGSVRDTVYFSFIKEDWPEVKASVFAGYS